jgi:hypothetical protein
VRGRPDGGIDVVVRGLNNAAWANSLSAVGVWSGWRTLGGRLIAAPAIAPDGTVAATGSDGGVWLTDLSGSRRWTRTGGRSGDGPALAESSAFAGLGIFVRGTDNRLWSNTCTWVGCAGWTSLGGVLIDAPGAVGTGAGVDVAVRGSDDSVWGRALSAGSWSAWQRAWVPFFG